MSKILILDKDAAVLRQVAKPVPLEDIQTKHTKKIISDMKSALHKETDGVAIAAPQIGESIRIFIINGETIASLEEHEDGQIIEQPDMIFINPELVKLSKKKRKMEEGCLSVRWMYGDVERSEKATVIAYDEQGIRFQVGASGLIAQIFQHEIDHLDGILFVDKATNLENIPPKENE